MGKATNGHIMPKSAVAMATVTIPTHGAAIVSTLNILRAPKTIDPRFCRLIILIST